MKSLSLAAAILLATSATTNGQLFEIREPRLPPPPSPPPPLRVPVDRLPATPRPSPPPTPAPTPAPTPPSSPKIVTLGDSYSSGTGLYQLGSQYDEEHGGYVAPWKLTARSDNECWRETDDLAGPWHAASQGIPSVFLACKGAELVSEAGTSGQFEPFANQIERMNSLYPGDAGAGWAGSTILFTIGGNDIRTVDGQSWPDLVEACIFQHRCDEKSENQVDNWQDVSDRLDAAYEKLAAEAHGARVRVMGYPRLFQRYTAWYIPDKCPGVTGIGRHEADFFDDTADHLNAIINACVNRAKTNHPQFDIRFVPVTSYITRGACRSSDREINDKVCSNTDNDLCFTSAGISDSSFHPSRRGYNKYADAFNDSL